MASVSNVLGLADRALTFIEKAAVAVLFLASVGVLVADIALRMTVGSSLSWAAELTRYAIVWLVFIGSSIGARSGAHISIDVFGEMVGDARARLLLQIASAISVAGCAVLAFYGWKLVEQMQQFRQISPSLRWPMWAVYTAIPVGFALMSLRFMQHLLSVSVEERRRAIAETSA